MDTVLILGATGQLGSYLSEFFLNKDYNVIGLVRRNSSNNKERIKDILHYKNFHLVESDILDLSSLIKILSINKPQQIYNTAAQSHVATSFNLPIYTFDVVAHGVLNLLESIKISGIDTRLLQYSSSEIFGDQVETYYRVVGGCDGFPLVEFFKGQKESTVMNPVSPYSVAKLAAYNLIRMYRKSYGMFASNIIMFNTESIPKDSPLIVRRNNFIDIIPIEDMFKSEGHRYEGIKDEFVGQEVWNGLEWTKIIDGNCYKDIKKETKIIQTRCSTYEATLEHISFDRNNNEVITNNWKVDDYVYECEYPNYDCTNFNDIDIAKFIGFVVGDGYISDDGRIRLTGTDKDLLIKMSNLVTKKYGWSINLYTDGCGNFDGSKKDVYNLNINNDRNFGLWLYRNIYTDRSKYKKIPTFILNANDDVRISFFNGYYLADGRKVGHERYYYKGFSTNSETLCLGLCMICVQSLKQFPKVKYRDHDGFKIFDVQLRRDLDKLHFNCKDPYQIIKTISSKSEDGWFFDIRTESQTFCTGTNLFKVHNSPKRGENFVTKKITKYIGALNRCNHKELFPRLKLGNINVYRDWSYVKDNVEASYAILNHTKADDFVVGTGTAFTIKDFLRIAFEMINENWEDYVEIDQSLLRPSEVEFLCADTTKIEKELGWKSKTKFYDLIKIMIDADKNV